MLILHILLLSGVLVACSALNSDTDEDGEVSFRIDFIEEEEENGLHSRYKRARGGKYKKHKREKKGKSFSKLSLNMKFPNGDVGDMILEKREKLSIAVDGYVIKGGVPVKKEKDAQKEATEYSVFADTNGTGSMFLMACDNEGCKTVGAIYNGTDIYTLDPASATPFEGKAHSVKEQGEKALHDVREMGYSKNGEKLNLPTNLRKKRDILLDSKMKNVLLNRRRRATNPGYVVELLIIVDYSEYKYWLDRSGNNAIAAEMTLELYYVLLTNMMDQRFASLSPDEPITFMLMGMFFAETEADSPWIQGNTYTDDAGNVYVDVDQALDDLTLWIYSVRDYLPPHDHVMSVSKMDFWAFSTEEGWSAAPIGAAWTGSMCHPGYSVSMIEDPGLGLIDFAAAHEIGHSFSSGHDSGAGCEADDYYLMGPSGGSPQGSDSLYNTGKGGNPYQFSACSAAAIKSFITSLNSQSGDGMCLKVSTYNETVYQSYKDFVAPGVFLPVDTQCELVYGGGSRRCYALDAAICSDGAWCWNPADPNYCHLMYVREGTLCGDQKRCHLGVCVDSSIVMPTCAPEIDTVINTAVVPLEGTTQLYTTVTPYSGTAQATVDTAVSYSQQSADIIC